MDKWITKSDIANWAATQSGSCQQSLPELIRRLIYATATSTEKWDFPCDSSVNTGGWDGYLETIAASPCFPSGISGWEMGIESSAITKANQDYKKRTTNSLGLKKKESTFVFVTPRAWPGRKNWEIAKKKEKKWKDVRVIAADELEAWLSLAPAVALWLANKIKKIASIKSRGIEELWDEWSLTTNPIMTTDVVIAGRTREMEKVHTWATQTPSLLEIQGDSPDEAFAFLYAAISKFPEGEKTKCLSRCVVIEDIHEFRSYIKTFSTPLIIAAPAECVPVASQAISKGHHVFLSIDSKTIDAGGRAIRLSRPQREPLEKALKASGLSELDTQRYLRDSGRSIAVLRRRLSTSSIVRKPTWVDSINLSVLISLLLVGAWNSDKEGDQKILEKLSGMEYKNLNAELEKLFSVDDSPVRHIGSVWILKAPLDAWFLIAPLITTEWLKKFEQVIHTVLTETDPKYDLTPDKRWAASLYGKYSQYSEWIRKGLVESLTLLAVYGDRAMPSNQGSQLFVDNVVSNIFSNASKWEIWASLKDVTPLLAEASPETFMDQLDEKIQDMPLIFTDLMGEDGVGLGECRHSGLLWALESLAWNSEYFFHSVNILTSLSKIDRGGGWSNRPANSLKDLFLPGLPQTNATPAERLSAFDVVAEREPNIAWKFAESYMHGSVSPSYQFRWRDNGGTRTGLDPENVKNHNEYIKGLLPRLEKLSYATKNNLIESVQNFVSVTDEIRKGILQALKESKPDEYLKEERDKMRANLRSTLNWLNSFGDQKMRAYVVPLNKILKHFEPKDIIEKVGWLVSDPWPRMPEGDRKNFEANDKNVLEKRKLAARELLNKAPLVDILKFSKTIQYVWFFGDALGRAIKSEKEEAKILDTILKDKNVHNHLVCGFAQGRITMTDHNWVSKQIKKLKKRGTYSAQACALLYMGLPEGASVWEEVKKQGPKVEKFYWEQASGFSREDLLKDSKIAIEKLLDVNRPGAALKIAGDHRNNSADSELLQRLLLSILSMDIEKEKHQLDSWHIEGVFQQLHDRNELSLEQIAKLEWPFIKILDNYGKGTLDLAIHKVLQRDPAFFTQLVSMLWKRDDHKPEQETPGITKKQKENMASNAWEVFHRWHLVPGFNSDGSVDEKALVSWVEAVREQSATIGKLIGCDLDIATILSRAPSDPDGIWPHIAVRNLIEKLKNKTIERHIPIGIYNDRGVTSRGMNDGGTLERDLSKKYLEMSKALIAKWPRTASILRSIAESYERDAKCWDVDSDLNDLKF